MATFDETPVVQLRTTDPDQNSKTSRMPTSVSRWIHERLPPLHELLCTHDLVRLTRRLRCVIAELCLIRRLSKTLKRLGHAVAGRRFDGIARLTERLGFTHNHGRIKRAPTRRCRRKRGSHGKASPDGRR
jgi:hypothetical protein